MADHPGSHDIFGGFLDQDFKRAFSSRRPQFGSQNFLDFFRRDSELARAEQDYQQQLNLLARSGQAPNLTPTQFFDNGFDFLQRYQGQTNRQRGIGSNSLTPSLNFRIPR